MYPAIWTGVVVVYGRQRKPTRWDMAASPPVSKARGGISRVTISEGLAEIRSAPSVSSSRIRKSGGGRKSGVRHMPVFSESRKRRSNRSRAETRNRLCGGHGKAPAVRRRGWPDPGFALNGTASARRRRFGDMIFPISTGLEHLFPGGWPHGQV
jgi:hypothetical protein